MKPHETLDEGTRTQAALYALGSLAAEDIAAYVDHLASCSLCRREVASYGESISALSALAPAVDPPPALRDRLLKQLGREPRLGPERVAPEASAGVQIWKDWAEGPSGSEMVFVPGGKAGWETTDVAGIEVRKLFVDAAQDRVTMLVRMAAGTAYPAHRHATAEECYVIEGDLLVGDRRMRAGDYQRVQTGSLHGLQSTEAGCLLFIVSSLHDELLQESRT